MLVRPESSTLQRTLANRANRRKGLGARRTPVYVRSALWTAGKSYCATWSLQRFPIHLETLCYARNFISLSLLTVYLNIRSRIKYPFFLLNCSNCKGKDVEFRAFEAIQRLGSSFDRSYPPQSNHIRSHFFLGCWWALWIFLVRHCVAPLRDILSPCPRPA